MTNINLYRINNPLQNPVQNNSAQNKTKKIENTRSFANTLDEVKSQEIKFSKHAQVRMKERNLILDKREMMKLTEALGKAEKKGVKDALIIMNNQAFIANIKSNTIVTAVSKDNLNGNIFTNIDGTVII